MIYTKVDGTKFVLVTTVSTYTDEWILDSTCSYHMCPNRDCFISLDVMSCGTVLMGNDYTCEKKGVRVVKLKLHNGTTRELMNVWYVLELKKNLISLGALEFNGFKVSMEVGVLKVTCGALVAVKGLGRISL